MSGNSLALDQVVFSLTHMYACLAIAELILDEGGFGLPTHKNGLGEMTSPEIKAMFDDFLQQVNLEVLCVNH